MALRWVIGRRGLTYKERLNLQSLEKINDLILTHLVLYKHIDLEEKPGLRIPSLKLLQ